MSTIKKLTAKDISNMLEVDLSTAKRYFRDMKIEYEPKSNIVTMAHFNDYFAIPLRKTVITKA